MPANPTADLPENLIAQVVDKELLDLVMQVSKKALAVQMDYLMNGTPEQRLAAAKGFMPIYAKVLAREDQDVNEQVYAETRRIMGSVIKRRKKSSG